jgi:hypothetical protein
MGNWNRLLAELDKTVGFPNKIRSSVKKRWQGYDQWKNEHVIWLEYRIKVNPGVSPPRKPANYLHDLHQTPAQTRRASMGTIRELMDVGFVNTVDSPPSPPSPKNGKRTTAKSSLRPRKLQPKSPASPITSA